jgi:hypothetical protein
VTSSDDFLRRLTSEDAAWADRVNKALAQELREAKPVAAVLGVLIEEMVRNGVPRDEAEARVFAAFRRLHDETKGKDEES